MSSVKVAVRVRPFNKREIDNGAVKIIEMGDQTTSIKNPRAAEDVKLNEMKFIEPLNSSKFN